MIRTKFSQANAYQAETQELLISMFYFIQKALLDKLYSAVQVTQNLKATVGYSLMLL